MHMQQSGIASNQSHHWCGGSKRKKRSWHAQRDRDDSPLRSFGCWEKEASDFQGRHDAQTLAFEHWCLKRASRGDLRRGKKKCEMRRVCSSSDVERDVIENEQRGDIGSDSGALCSAVSINVQEASRKRKN
jgi:hypothetical protein